MFGNKSGPLAVAIGTVGLGLLYGFYKNDYDFQIGCSLAWKEHAEGVPFTSMKDKMVSASTLLISASFLSSLIAPFFINNQGTQSGQGTQDNCSTGLFIGGAVLQMFTIASVLIYQFKLSEGNVNAGYNYTAPKIAEGFENTCRSPSIALPIAFLAAKLLFDVVAPLVLYKCAYTRSSFSASLLGRLQSSPAEEERSLNGDSRLTTTDMLC